MNFVKDGSQKLEQEKKQNSCKLPRWNDPHFTLTLVLFILSQDEKRMAQDQMRITSS